VYPESGLLDKFRPTSTLQELAIGPADHNTQQQLRVRGQRERVRRTGYEWPRRFSRPARSLDRYTDKGSSSARVCCENRDSNCAEFFSTEKQVSILALAAKASRSRSSGEWRSLSRASASWAGLVGGTR